MSSFVYFFLGSKFKILYASSNGILLVFACWKLLKLNLPEFLSTFNNPQILKSCIKDNPAFVFIIGNIISRKGKEKINLPAKIINKANPIEAKIISFLIKLDIFLLDVLVNQFSNKYRMTKITTDIKKKFMY